MKPKKPLDTTTIAVFALTILSDDKLYENILVRHHEMNDITFVDHKVMMTQYKWNHVKH